MRAEILIDDITERFHKGEIGLVLENDFTEKYSYKILLPGTIELDKPFKVSMKRIFYFFDREVKLLD